MQLNKMGGLTTLLYLCGESDLFRKLMGLDGLGLGYNPSIGAT